MKPAIACPVAPEGQGVTFIELFFDLVFVFSVTQVVGLLHHGLDWVHVGQALLVFWLVWWAWTQFTWALNAADTTHTTVQVGVLVATAVTFFMASAVPDAFRDKGLWFGGGYVAVRLIGLVLYVWVVGRDADAKRAVKTFALASVLGLVAVLAGAYLGGPWQYGLWGVAIALDVRAALGSVRVGGWRLALEHFAERHGLFVIIALGECLIVAAHGLEAGAWTGGRIGTAVLAVGATCALWWTYFPRAKPALERAVEASTGLNQVAILRDVFTLAHFPMLCGVVGFAVAVDQAMTHYDQPFGMATRAALIAAVVLFQGGMGLALWRAAGSAPWMRFLWTALAAGALALVHPLSPWLAMAITMVGAGLLAGYEQRSECTNQRRSAEMNLGGD
ncbi:MAG: low temperature requirement protein A [Planctomycetes bacterium]|nr:low temperature requirement protein A [Planctomycetota bacterium]MCB9910225.1 low temperature requirement protein A [Planctomycetota bacterium]